MADDIRTTKAVDCDDCGLLTIPATDPKKLMDRLPESLWNRARPEEDFVPEFKYTDIMYEDTVYGPLGLDSTTPQWELMRLFAQEKDYFRTGWLQTVANQLAIGTVRLVGNMLQAECPRGAGEDLDRVGQQYGIGRPYGFTDCCYWRLLILLLFQPGPTAWRVREIAHLYTGQRPASGEQPNVIFLQWPYITGETPGITFWMDGGVYPVTDRFWDQDGFWQEDAPGENTDFDGYWYVGVEQEAQSFWQSDLSLPPPGLRLREALKLAAPAGVVVSLINPPFGGLAGCSGATARGEVVGGRGIWNLAPGDTSPF